MKLVVGLGNPGEKYVGTRHNVGFWVVEMVFRQVQDVWQVQDWKESAKFDGFVAKGKDVVLLKPSTFMNESGRAVAAAAHFYKLKPEDIYIIHDDLDIRLGSYKIQLGKGPRKHYGIASVEKTLGTCEFWRVRVGVESREVVGNKGVPGMEYVLKKFTNPERKLVGEVGGEVIDELLTNW